MLRRSIALAVALLLVLATAPVASADEHATHRPIWANLGGEVNFYTLTGTYDLNGEDPYTMLVTGGTGRFDGAQGALAVDFQLEGEWANGLPVNPWHGWLQIRGTISY